MRGYGLFSLLYLSICVFITKLFFRPARLIRFPLSIRYKKNVHIGKGFTTGVGCRIDALELPSSSLKGKISFGRDVQINDYVHIASVSSVSIGDSVLIASKVFISDHNHGSYSGSEGSDPRTSPSARPLIASPVRIEDNVWIGEFVSVLPGVTIGKGAVIGSNSVVTCDIPEYSIAVGSPAKIIKTYDVSTGTWVKV